jgi:hypothetical protein
MPWDFLASWGWAILFIGAIVSLFLNVHVGKIAVFTVIAAAALYWFAGFKPEGFGMGVMPAIAFLTGVLVGGWGWLLLIALLVGPFVCIEKETDGLALVFIVASAVMLYFVTGINLFALILLHPFYSVVAFALYALAGAAWSWFKWERFVDKIVDQLQDKQRVFIAKWQTFVAEAVKKLPERSGQFGSKGLSWYSQTRDMSSAQYKEALEKMQGELTAGKIPDELLENWHGDGDTRKVSVFRHKERILSWIAFWPWSLLTYLFLDLLREVWEQVFKRMVRLYQAVVDRKYATLDQRIIKTESY